jgi:hypothetical protein
MKHTTVHYTSDISGDPIPDESLCVAALFHDRRMDPAGSPDDWYTRFHLSPKEASNLISALRRYLTRDEQEKALTEAFGDRWVGKGEES